MAAPSFCPWPWTCLWVCSCSQTVCFGWSAHILSHRAAPPILHRYHIPIPWGWRENCRIYWLNSECTWFISPVWTTLCRMTRQSNLQIAYSHGWVSSGTTWSWSGGTSRFPYWTWQQIRKTCLPHDLPPCLHSDAFLKVINKSVCDCPEFSELRTAFSQVQVPVTQFTILRANVK